MPSSSSEFDTFISYPFQLSGGMARLYLPPQLTKNDVARLQKMLESLIIEKQGPNDAK